MYDIYVYKHMYMHMNVCIYIYEIDVIEDYFSSLCHQA